MKKQLMILWTLLLPLALLLGGCYSLQKVPSKRLNEAKLVKNTRYHIRGVYLKDGSYEAFDVQSETLRSQFDLPEKYRGAFRSGDTLYGTQASYEQIAIPLDQIEKYEKRSDGRGGVWIEAVYLRDGSSLRFAREELLSPASSDTAMRYQNPVIIGDSLHARLLTTIRIRSLAIPVDQVERYRMYKSHPVMTAVFIGEAMAMLYGLVWVIYSQYGY